MNPNDEKELQKFLDEAKMSPMEEKEFREFLGRLDNQIRASIIKKNKALKLNKIFFTVVILISFIIVGLLIVNFFVTQIEPYIDFTLAMLNTLVVIYAVYTNHSYDFDFRKASIELKGLKIISWLLILFNLCALANYIVTVFNIQISY